MTAKAAQKERTRASIVASACELLRARGIGGARVADVMSAAGLTVGGFYAHFPTKRALVDEALRRTSAETRARLFEGIDDKPAAVQAAVILKRYLSVAHRDEPENGCPMPAVVSEVATTSPEHRDALAEQIGILADGIAGHLPGDRPPASRRATAIAMVALMYGGLTLARAVRGTALSDEILRACRSVWKAPEPR